MGIFGDLPAISQGESFTVPIFHHFPWMEAMDFPHRQAAAELYESIDAAREAVNCYIAGEVWILDLRGPVGWRSGSLDG